MKNKYLFDRVQLKLKAFDESNKNVFFLSLRSAI